MPGTVRLVPEDRSDGRPDHDHKFLWMANRPRACAKWAPYRGSRRGCQQVAGMAGATAHRRACAWDSLRGPGGNRSLCMAPPVGDRGSEGRQHKTPRGRRWPRAGRPGREPVDVPAGIRRGDRVARTMAFAGGQFENAAAWASAPIPAPPSPCVRARTHRRPRRRRWRRRSGSSRPAPRRTPRTPPAWR